MSEEEEIKRIRTAIDALDRQLIELLNARAAKTVEIGEIKKSGDGAVAFYRPDREAAVLRKIRDLNQGPLPDDDAVRLLREVMSACLALEQPLRVAYLGPEGTYTHAAAARHFGGSVTLMPCTTIGQVFREVESGACDYGVVAIENSLEGAVNQTLDCLSETSLNICGEVRLGVHHQLLCSSSSVADIKRVCAHQQALAQCREWLDRNLSTAERNPVASNALAAQLAAEDETCAAIASEHASRLYAVPVLERNIEDHPQNTTRFAVIGQQLPESTGDDLTSIVFSMANRPGALHSVLSSLAREQISMSRIESRPIKNGAWDYLFFVDLEGHCEDAPVAAAIESIRAQTSMFKVLGSYPRSAL
ncbi:MAG: prephenate dehydratase [Pseudomonadota bacterium]